MQIALLEAQIKRDLRMLRLAIECRLRKFAIAVSRRVPDRVIVKCSAASWHVWSEAKKEFCDLGRLSTTIARLQRQYGSRVVPEFYDCYQNGERC